MGTLVAIIESLFSPYLCMVMGLVTVQTLMFLGIWKIIHRLNPLAELFQELNMVQG